LRRADRLGRSTDYGDSVVQAFDDEDPVIPLMVTEDPDEPEPYGIRFRSSGRIYHR
jgi:hypothetical protein